MSFPKGQGLRSGRGELPTFQAAGLTLYKRLTLVITDGVIEHVFYAIFPPNEHAQEVLAWLRSNSLLSLGEAPS